MLIRTPRHAGGRLALTTVLVVFSVLVVSSVVVADSVAATEDPVAGGSDVSYVPPVDGPVVDGFRPPELPYGPGNRGLKYAARPGEPVHASADGVVTFAGQVGGTLHVTVGHADGVRTSYSFLASVGVGRGQRVGQGDPVGTAGDVLHFGARRGDAYIDPASLFDRSGPVELVPFEAAPGATADEVEPLRQIALGENVGRDDAARRQGRSVAAGWLRDTATTARVAPRDPTLDGPLPGADHILDVMARVAESATRAVFALAS